MNIILADNTEAVTRSVGSVTVVADDDKTFTIIERNGVLTILSNDTDYDLVLQAVTPREFRINQVNHF